MTISQNLRLVIVIWGTAILVYLLITNAAGTRTALGALSDLVNTGTRTLQGRG